MARSLNVAALVVLLTALIWAWAEKSQVATLQDRTIKLRLEVPHDSDVVVTPVSEPGNWRARVEVTVVASFSGPQSGISELTQKIDRQEYPPVVVLAAPRNGDPRIELDVSEVLRNQPQLAQLHCTLTRVTPGRAVLDVSQLQEYSLDVDPAYSDGQRREARVDPAKATVKLPRALYESLDKKIIPATVRVGPTTDLSLPVVGVLPADLKGFPIQPSPTTVMVRTNVGLREISVENVPVFLAMPRDMSLAGYDLVTDKDQWRKNVVVSGPSEKTVTAADIHVYLRLERSDLSDVSAAAAPLTRNVEITVPTGFKLISPDDKSPDRAISFRFVKKAEEHTPP